MKDKRKKKVDVLVDCPWCRKPIHIEAGSDILTPGVKAETQPYVEVERHTQTKLPGKEEHGTKSGRKNIKA